MFESTSPFDDALSKPFLDEPVKKRWWLGTFSSGSKSSALSHSSWGSSAILSHSQSSHAASAVLDFDDYPDLEAIEFKTSDDHKHDDLLGVLLSPSSIGSSKEAYDLDFAIIRERHQDITDITKSLLQLNEIEKDLATVVDSQGNTIQDLETMAIESLDHASSGVSHILSMQAKLYKSSKEYRHWYAAAIAILLFACAHWIRIRSSRFEADDDDMPDY